MWIQLNLRDSQQAIPVEDAIPAVSLKDVVPEAPATEPLPKTEGVPTGQTPKKRWVTRVILGTVLFMTLWYLDTSAMRFFNFSRDTYGIFWPRREWLLVHVIAGALAILIGPLQFWPGLKEKYPSLHRGMGVLYVMSAGVGGVAAFYLAFHTDFGWMFSMGLSAMAAAWMISTGLATVAIYRRMIPQHKEWMIRSYVVTFGFVLIRLTTSILDMSDVGSVSDRFAVASWISWSLPLLLTETVLQGRKIFARSDSRIPNETA
jgi:predicted membrane protein DUF2306